MKIRIFRKECVYGLLLIALSLFMFRQKLVNGEWFMAIIMILGSMLPVLLVVVFYQELVLKKDCIILISNIKNKKISRNRIKYRYSDFSYVYFVTIKDNQHSTRWIIFSREDQKYNRISIKELSRPIDLDTFVAMKYSKKRKKIVLDCLKTNANIRVENIEVDNSSGKRNMIS